MKIVILPQFTKQSTTYPSNPASYAVDGSETYSCTERLPKQGWYVDLQMLHDISHIVVAAMTNEEHYFGMFVIHNYAFSLDLFIVNQLSPIL